MNKANFEKWQVLQDQFLNGNLDEKEFCKSKKLDLKWFREQLHEQVRKKTLPQSLQCQTQKVYL